MLGRVFDEVPGLCDRVRPGYPAALFWDLADITGIGAGSDVLEVGCGTGQATRQLAELAGVVAAVEPGDGMADHARHRLADLGNVHIERSAFEAWDDAGRRFDAVVAASSWHWVDPAVGWRRAHDVLRPGGWLAMLGHIVVRRPGEAEVYAETADVHEGSRREIRTGVIRLSRTTFALPIRAGVRSTRITTPCSARPWCAGTRPCSGSTDRASLTCCERCRRIESSLLRFGSPCSTPSPIESGPGSVIPSCAAISPCCASASDSTETRSRLGRPGIQGRTTRAIEDAAARRYRPSVEDALRRSIMSTTNRSTMS
jgi:protein-L-isoaspartate O-methyltransferase